MRRLLLVIIGMLLVVCSTAFAQAPPPPPTENVTAIVLTADEYVIEQNQATTLTATLQFAEGVDPTTYADSIVTFEILSGPEDANLMSELEEGDQVIAYTDENGVATAQLIAGVTTGEVTVKAFYGDKEDTITIQIVEEIPELPDLIVDDITTSPEQPVANSTATVTVTVMNTGTADAGAFNVLLYVNGNPIETKSVEGLTVGSSRDVEFTWTPNAEGNYTLRALVDPENAVEELNEENNEMTKEVTVISVICGDVNGDGKVTLVDAMFVAQYFVGVRSELPNPLAADVNCDDQITMVDAMFIAQYFIGIRPSLGC